MTSVNAPNNVAQPSTDIFSTALPVTFASRTGSAQSETLNGSTVEPEKAEIAGEAAESESPAFSQTTKWTLLGLFSLGLFIDV